MKTLLTRDDCVYLLACLNETKHKYESTDYPTYELKRDQIEKVERVQEKLRLIRDEADK
ncbi:TPA: hypothetical protein P0E07_001869 [Vibrio fluvialis]|nr:hypothetical protein [Vibrio fluvialis]